MKWIDRIVSGLAQRESSSGPDDGSTGDVAADNGVSNSSGESSGQEASALPITEDRTVGAAEKAVIAAALADDVRFGEDTAPPRPPLPTWPPSRMVALDRGAPEMAEGERKAAAQFLRSLAQTAVVRGGVFDAETLDHIADDLHAGRATRAAVEPWLWAHKLRASSVTDLLGVVDREVERVWGSSGYAKMMARRPMCRDDEGFRSFRAELVRGDMEKASWLQEELLKAIGPDTVFAGVRPNISRILSYAQACGGDRGAMIRVAEAIEESIDPQYVVGAPRFQDDERVRLKNIARAWRRLSVAVIKDRKNAMDLAETVIAGSYLYLLNLDIHARYLGLVGMPPSSDEETTVLQASEDKKGRGADAADVRGKGGKPDGSSVSAVDGGGTGVRPTVLPPRGVDHEFDEYTAHFSDDLMEAIARAAGLAESKGHISPDYTHFLHALTEDEAVLKKLTKLKVNVGDFRKDLFGLAESAEEANRKSRPPIICLEMRHGACRLQGRDFKDDKTILTPVLGFVGLVVTAHWNGIPKCKELSKVLLRHGLTSDAMNAFAVTDFDDIKEDGSVGVAHMRVLDNIVDDGSGRQKPSVTYGDILKPLPVAGRSDPDKVFAQLQKEFPWMREANLTVATAAAVSARRPDGMFRIEPTILVGPPGVGKSRWGRRVSEIAGIGIKMASMSGVNNSFYLGGSERGWADARPSLPALAFKETQIANPLILVDEVDKAGTSSHNGMPIGPLFGMLEPETARRFPDPFLLGNLDLTAVSFVLTANSIDSLPDPIIQRCRVVRIRRPNAHEFSVIWPAMVNEAAAALGLDPETIDLSDVGKDATRLFSEGKDLRALRTQARDEISAKLWTPPGPRLVEESEAKGNRP